VVTVLVASASVSGKDNPPELATAIILGGGGTVKVGVSLEAPPAPPAAVPPPPLFFFFVPVTAATRMTSPNGPILTCAGLGVSSGRSTGLAVRSIGGSAGGSGGAGGGGWGVGAVSVIVTPISELGFGIPKVV
jgi:hypothetical protein